MNKESQVVSLRTSGTMENEAADWLVKLDKGDLSDDDRRALKSWLSQDPEHIRTLKNYASIWSDMDYLLNDIPLMNDADKPHLYSYLFRTNQVVLGFAAMFFCAIGLFIWMTEQPGPSDTSFYVTSVGDQQTEHFSDGSIAYINTNSMIEAEYSDEARIVRLLRGEAMFDVVHDEARPFIVYAGNREVKAIGTKFVVRLTSKNIVVTVTDGQVQLSKRTKKIGTIASAQQQEIILISKGEEISIDVDSTSSELKEIEIDELKRKLSWIEGQLIFKNERLEQVISEISRYVPDRIIIDDPELRDIRISGRFEIGDTDALLEAIEVSFSVQADHAEDKVIHLSR